MLVWSWQFISKSEIGMQYGLTSSTLFLILDKDKTWYMPMKADEHYFFYL
jgi:dipeptidase